MAASLPQTAADVNSGAYSAGVANREITQMPLANSTAHKTYFTPSPTAQKNASIAKLRISGNEPTLAKEHLLEILELVDQTSYSFILETNGLLIDEDYADSLKEFRNLHVRVSIKGSNPEEFTLLTLAKPEYFHYQVNALRHLYGAGVSCHAAVMLSMTPKQNLQKLKMELKNISAALADDLEEEYIFLYPHVVKRLRKHKMKPLIAYTPDGIPEELI